MWCFQICMLIFLINLGSKSNEQAMIILYEFIQTIYNTFEYELEWKVKVIHENS